MHLLFARHGHHPLVGRALAGRMAGVALDAEGLRDADLLAVRLANSGIGAIYCSPQQRTRETAAPIAERLGLSVAIAPEFDEVDFGAWTGLGFDEVRGHPLWETWVHRRSTATAPGGEAFADVRARAMEGVQRLVAAHPQGTVLVVSHADVIRAVVATVLGMSLDDLERFEIVCATVTAIEAGEGWAKLMRLNAPA